MIIGNDWDVILADYFESEDFKRTWINVAGEYRKHTCFPAKENIFAALKATSYHDTKVVILGQDPYYSIPQADGFAFSVTTEKLPPSLVNIFKCIKNDYPSATFASGSLKEWAQQGVLLLNTSLSVRQGMPTSHTGYGWDKLVRLVIDALNSKGGVVFMLWGSFAQKLLPKTDYKSGNLYLTAVHPSPLSAHLGFLTCGHFKKCNEFLGAGREIDFSIRTPRE